MTERFNHRYILDGQQPVPEPDVLRWMSWMEEQQDRLVVEQTSNGVLFVSTVFLGLNSNPFEGSPVVFETMSFFTPEFEKAKRDLDLDFPFPFENQRWRTWEEAKIGHQDIIQRLIEQLKSFGGPVRVLIDGYLTEEDNPTNE